MKEDDGTLDSCSISPIMFTDSQVIHPADMMGKTLIGGLDGNSVLVPSNLTLSSASFLALFPYSIVTVERDSMQ